MNHWFRSVVAALLLTAPAVSCGGAPSKPGTTLPPITGVVTTVSREPLAGAKVSIDGAGSTVTNESGRYTFPSQSTDTFRPLLRVVAPGFLDAALTIATSPSSASVTLNVTMIARLTLIEPGLVRTALSDFDSNFDADPYASDGGYPCGPCRRFELGRQFTGRQLLITWDADVPLSAWLEATDRLYETARIGEWTAEAGERQLSIDISPSWNGTYYYPLLKVGLPYQVPRLQLGRRIDIDISLIQ